MVDFKDILDEINKTTQKSPGTQWVVITGTLGYENFNFAVMGIDVFIPVRNTRCNFKRLPHTWVFSIYEKHGPYKIVFNCKTKEFKAFYYTEPLGPTKNSADACFKNYIQNHKNNYYIK
jgi:hypothetical protein